MASLERKKSSMIWALAEIVEAKSPKEGGLAIVGEAMERVNARTSVF